MVNLLKQPTTGGLKDEKRREGEFNLLVSKNRKKCCSLSDSAQCVKQQI